MTDWDITPHGWFRDGRKHKSSSLARLLEDLPQITWVLVGDDGEHDPHLYGDLAEAHPDRVAAIALRHVRPTAPTGTGREEGAGSTDGVPILRCVDGNELLPLLRDALNRRPSATRSGLPPR